MEKPITFAPGMALCQSGRFAPGAVACPGGNGAEVTADNILLDFTGLVLQGPGPAAKQQVAPAALHEEFSYDDAAEAARVRALGYAGTALTLHGRRNVTIRGLAAHGFLRGIYLENCENITVEGCDFSRNFDDEDCGWNEHPPLGGIILRGSSGCIIRHNRANRVWNALSLTASHRNLAEDNDFSHCSNMCVKMWNACHNKILRNNLSWGLRIRPGETHARDSAGLLMEAGSDGNQVIGNDITHGGDGIFVRVLNGWHSRFNLFADNDCSYANNNAIEAWAVNNTYLRNKASHSSYGFWLGGSDFTVLQGNEVAWNGRGFANAPESFGNAGIAVVNGSGTGLVLADNAIYENAGPGVALRFEEGYPIQNVVLQGNRIHHNRTRVDYAGHGIFLKNAANITLAGNTIEENEGEAVHNGGSVQGLRILPGQGAAGCPALAAAFPPQVCTVGEALPFAAAPAEKTAEVHWDFGDGTAAAGPAVHKTYATPGGYYAGVQALGGCGAGLGGQVLYALPAGQNLLPAAAVAVAAIPEEELTAALREGLACRCQAGVMEVEFPRPVALGAHNTLALLLHLHGEARESDDATATPRLTLRLEQDGENWAEWRSRPAPAGFTAAGRRQNWADALYRYIQLPLGGENADYTYAAGGKVERVRRLVVAAPQKAAGQCWFALRALVLCTLPQSAAVPPPPKGEAVLTEIRFKANQERHDTEDKTPVLTLALHRCEEGKPHGKALFLVQLAPGRVQRGGVTAVNTGRLTLPPGQYAVVFGQSPAAPGRDEGAFYRFPSQKRAGRETQGALKAGGWVEETHIWGCLWLQAVCEGRTINLGHQSESYGARIGIPEAEQRWQSFTIE